MGTDIIYIKTDDIYKEIVEGVETRFDTPNDKSDRPLPKEKDKKKVRRKSHDKICWIKSKNL